MRMKTKTAYVAPLCEMECQYLPFYGFYMELRSGAKDPNASSRSFGFSVRPVQD